MFRLDDGYWLEDGAEKRQNHTYTIIVCVFISNYFWKFKQCERGRDQIDRKNPVKCTLGAVIFYFIGIGKIATGSRLWGQGLGALYSSLVYLNLKYAELEKNICEGIPISSTFSTVKFENFPFVQLVQFVGIGPSTRKSFLPECVYIRVGRGERRFAHLSSI